MHRLHWVIWVILSLAATSSPKGFAVEYRTDLLRETEGDWNVAEGFRLSEHATPLYAPVGVGAVHHPGPKPEDITHFISELRGGIKGITRSGKVRDIAVDSNVFRPDRELPNMQGENGQTGLCISLDDRFVYTTGIISSGVAITNAVTQWRVVGEGESLQLKRVQTLKKPFQNDLVRGAHQIGQCLVSKEGNLVIGVGDASIHETASAANHVNGKIIRLTPDLKGVPSNPFYEKSDPLSVKSIVYTLGMRNPFAVAEGPDAFYVSDNGIFIDRFVRLEKGRDYHWDGDDRTMIINNDLTLAEPIGPAGMVWVPMDHPLEKLRGHFVVSASHKAGLLAIPYRPGHGVTGSPWWVVKSKQGEKIRQDFTGVALTDQSLFVAHIRMHQKEGLLPSALMRLESSALSGGAKLAMTGDQLVTARGCRGCHTIAGWGKKIGPDLDGLMGRIQSRLSDSAYLQKWGNQLPEDPSPKQWIIQKLLKPTFDNPQAGMPQFGFSKKEAEDIADYLIETTSGGAPQAEAPARWFWVMKANSVLQSTLALVGIALFLGLFLGFAGRKGIQGIGVLVKKIRSKE